MSDVEDDVHLNRSGRLRERKATKVMPPRAAKLSFKYESQDLENAVSAVLCGMSIKEAASSYHISKNVLKQALTDEIDMEPQEDGSVVDGEEKTIDSDGQDSISSRVAECQAVYESQKSENAKRKVAEAMKFRSVGTGSITDGLFGDEIEVTCGFCSGTLYRRKFFCPGLHCECILTEGQWVTPKQFSIMGGKASLKNWKNAIRINNVNLRNFMEQGSLDFCDHQINCSGKCYHKTSGGPGKYQSKINCLERKTLGNIETLTQTLTGPNQLLEENLNDDIPSFVPMVQNVANSQAFSVLRKAQGKGDKETEDNQPVFPSPVIKTELPDNGEYDAAKSPTIDAPVLNITPVTSGDIPPQQSLLLRNQVIQAQKQKALQSSSQSPGTAVEVQAPGGGDTAGGIGNATPANLSTVRYLIQNGVIKGQVKQIGSHQFVLQNNLTDQPPEILQVASSFPDIESIMKDSKKFWQGIYDIGLLTEIFTEIKSKMRSMKHEMYNFGITDENADKLSLLVNNLGLQTKVKYKLANHKVAAEAQNRKIQEEINDLQRKMDDSQKRQAELKRKSHCFEQLLQKRPRLKRDSSLSDDNQEKPRRSKGQETLGTISKEEEEEEDTDEETDENESETRNSEKPNKTVKVVNTENGVGVSVKIDRRKKKKTDADEEDEEESNTQSDEDEDEEREGDSEEENDNENADSDSEKSS